MLTHVAFFSRIWALAVEYIELDATIFDLHNRVFPIVQLNKRLLQRFVVSAVVIKLYDIILGKEF